MAEGTNISWCDDTVNFWSGCTKVSTGCANCYADALSARFDTFGKWGKDAPRRLHESAFKLAHRLNKKPWVHNGTGIAYQRDLGNCHRRRIFSLSLGDWLDPEVPVEWLARMLDTIRQCDQVTWILCSKRPELWRERIQAVQFQTEDADGNWLDCWLSGEPPKHVWLLASVENQEMADKRIPDLIEIPAKIHGLSCEPLLGPIDLSYWLEESIVPQLKWCVAGGESGPKARPCNTAWIRSLVQQCKSVSVPVFVKQMGSHVLDDQCHSPYSIPDSQCWPVERGVRGDEATCRVYLKNSKGGDPSEWPGDLRIQEYPKQSQF